MNSDPVFKLEQQPLFLGAIADFIGTGFYFDQGNPAEQYGILAEPSYDRTDRPKAGYDYNLEFGEVTDS